MKPTRVLFVCHGNICRSPMAECVLRHLAECRGVAHLITAASAATSTEALGGNVHPGTRQVLRAQGVECPPRRAVQLTKADFDKYDYLVAMDTNNLRNMQYILGPQAMKSGKVRRLLDFTGRTDDIEDPWYTGDFDATYDDVRMGCEALLNTLEQQDL